MHQTLAEETTTMDVKKNILQRMGDWIAGSKQSEPAITAEYLNQHGNTRMLFSMSFNGEKNLGELGPVMNYKPDSETLRARAWDAYVTNEVVQIIVNRFTTWVIGRGLKLQAEPMSNILESENIKIDSQKFSELVESRWSIYSGTELCDLANQVNLGILESRAYRNVKIGGDVLVVLRYIDGQVKVQLIDGAHVRSPFGFGTEECPQEMENGNRCINGIEMNDRGEHVAYWVETTNFKFQRVTARSKETGLKIAFLVSGLEYRIDTVRSISAVATTLESLAKLDRYKEATLGSAEERQKIPYFFEHQQFSDGSSPLIDRVVEASGHGPNLPVTDDGTSLANKVTVTTNKQTFNMPKGATVKSLESKNELHFKDFYSVNFDLICASIGIPPEVAASKYDSNFSSARAAIKDWENTLIVERERFAYQFMQPIYAFWLEMQILENKIQAPGYIMARTKNDAMVLAAYRKSRFIGASVPHIDPLKEVEAERLKLGESGKHIPLTTVERATETLNGGDSNSNIEQFGKEFDKTKTLKITPKEPKPIVAPKPKD